MVSRWGMCHHAWTVASGLPLSCLLWPHGVVYCLWPFSSCILAAYGRTGPSVRPHVPSLCANIIVRVHASLRCRADGGCIIMLGRLQAAFRCPASCGLTVWWNVCNCSHCVSRRHMGRTGPSVRPHAPSRIQPSLSLDSQRHRLVCPQGVRWLPKRTASLRRPV